MTPDEKLNAFLQELAHQRNLMGDRALNLAAQLAEAKQRIEELEQDNAELRKREPPRVVKS